MNAKNRSRYKLETHTEALFRTDGKGEQHKCCRMCHWSYENEYGIHECGYVGIQDDCIGYDQWKPKCKNEVTCETCEGCGGYAPKSEALFKLEKKSPFDLFSKMFERLHGKDGSKRPKKMYIVTDPMSDEDKRLVLAGMKYLETPGNSLSDFKGQCDDCEEYSPESKLCQVLEITKHCEFKAKNQGGK